MKGKFLIFILVAALVGGVLGYLNGTQQVNIPVLDEWRGGAGIMSNTVTLLSSTSNCVSLPLTYVEGYSTTTDSSNAVNQLEDGGNELIQQLSVAGANTVILHGLAIGGTATSSLFIKQQVSLDGSTFIEDFATSTDVILPIGTSTTKIAPRIVSFDPGIATTSFAIPFDVVGWNYARFVMYGEDVATEDPNDGVQAFIQATVIEDIPR